MIFADKIVTLRKRNGWSQEDLAARVNVSRQAVAKWEAAQSVPSLDKIIQLSQIFDVTTDYLLKDEEEEIVFTQDTPDCAVRHVSLQEAGHYLDSRPASALINALGVSLCILSPVTLLCLGVLSEFHLYGMTENTAGAIGLIVLLVMVAAAVGLFIWNDQIHGKPWEFLEKDDFVLDYGVRGMVKERQAAQATRKLALTIIGVLLFVLCPIPIFAAMFTSRELYMGLSVCVTLVLVAAGVWLVIVAEGPSEAMDRLLQEGDYAPDKRKQDKVMAPFSAAFWLVITGIYLFWSFQTDNWDKTWLIWPVAGVLFAAIRIVADAIMSRRETR